MNYIILYNRHSQFCRQFIAQYREKYPIIEWYDDNKEREQYLSDGNPHPSAFPCVVDIDNKVIANLFDFDTMETAKAKIEDEIFRKQCESDGKSYVYNRRKRYEAEGLMEKDWERARIQKEVDGDSTEWDSLITKREEIKKRIPKNLTEIDDAKEHMSKNITLKANALILSAFPEIQQMQMVQRAVELLEKKVDSELTQDEENEILAIKNIKIAAKNIRDQESAMIAEVNDLAELSDIMNYNITFST